MINEMTMSCQFIFYPLLLFPPPPPPSPNISYYPLPLFLFIHSSSTPCSSSTNSSANWCFLLLIAYFFAFFSSVFRSPLRKLVIKRNVSLMQQTGKIYSLCMNCMIISPRKNIYSMIES